MGSQASASPARQPSGREKRQAQDRQRCRLGHGRNLRRRERRSDLQDRRKVAEPRIAIGAGDIEIDAGGSAGNSLVYLVQQQLRVVDVGLAGEPCVAGRCEVETEISAANEACADINRVISTGAKLERIARIGPADIILSFSIQRDGDIEIRRGGNSKVAGIVRRRSTRVTRKPRRIEADDYRIGAAELPLTGRKLRWCRVIIAAIGRQRSTQSQRFDLTGLRRGN